MNNENKDLSLRIDTVRIQNEEKKKRHKKKKYLMSLKLVQSSKHLKYLL